MLFSKVGVYKADHDGGFIVELGHEAENAFHAIHTSSPMQQDEVRNLLRHVQLSEREIDECLEGAAGLRTASAAR